MEVKREKVNDVLRKRDYRNVVFDIEGENFEVGILKEVKERHLKDALGRMLLWSDVLGVSAEVATVYGAILSIETLTNIEFPEDLEEKLDFFLELDEIGLLQRVLEVIGDKKLQDFSDRMKKLAEDAEKLFEGVNKVE